MRYQSLIAISIATPALASFSLDDLETIQSDVVNGCKTAYNAKIQSCGQLPGSCSSSCQDDLKSAASNIILTCRMTNDPKGLLKSVFSGSFVHEMCSGGQRIDNESTLVFSTNANSALASPTLAIDPAFAATKSADNVLATATAPSPTSKYAPSTIQTSKAGATSSPSPQPNGGQPADANGSLFGSTENQNSASSRIHVTEMTGALVLLSMVVAAFA